MVRFFKTHAEATEPQDLPADQPHGVTSVGRSQNAWQWLIGYNNVEANRIGVPMVSVPDYFEGWFSNPGSKVSTYLGSLFPFTRWIGSYNLSWAFGDCIAGLTVALVLVPQSMSYAIVATLPAEYGLYSSFVGVMIYAFFATSKDVTIGPVAVMSLQVANVIVSVTKQSNEWSGPVIASALAFLCGVVTLGIGLLRLGWLVEFIPAPAVSGFMTGSAFTIAAGQVKTLMGITNVSTTGVPCYLVIINTLKGLPRTHIDAAFGFVALFALYAIRSACIHIPRRYPKLARPCFFISVFRNAFVLIVLTIASRLYCGPHGPKGPYPISILKTVPSGFQHVGRPNLNTGLFSAMGSQLPVSVIILLLEHIAIAKSFGRLNNYKINPNQELLAIGVTNLVGPCFGAYPATGSFSRSAIKAKSGVRTPLAGWLTGILVLISIYALTGVFYWIPSAGLSAVIIHAVGDLIASPRVIAQFWYVSPLECLIFAAAVIASIFDTLEVGVYVSVGASLALLLIRIAHPRGRWLGKVTIHHGDSPTVTVADGEAVREVFVPLDDKDGLRDPSIRVEAPPAGVFIYRFEESFTYPNASHLADLIVDYIKTHTRPGSTQIYKKPGDRPWNDPGPINPYLGRVLRPFTFGSAKRKLTDKIDESSAEVEHDPRPLLKSLILDFGAVSNVDTTSVQTLVDIRVSLERYANGPVEFHFASILSPWIRRGLLAGGFGTGASSRHITEIAPVVLSDPHNKEEANLAQIHAYARRYPSYSKQDSEFEAVHKLEQRRQGGTPSDSQSASSDNKDRLAEEGIPVAGSHSSAPIMWGQDLTPFFHLDLSAALASAVTDKSRARDY
ncbi:putative sulfate permease [Microstroma glucosiphilum]|uniref:Putative sulfate permease n=1 Tax=Pseudomicrostroma glucosiphilum TaxID=1684307 RepID=A0A316U3Q8_9BASI|nr:putative sulfate permease [Pseudomicrostroma glucosiphilum]PWN19800.1 putative sulfate permease [Pseudomicrostroma glucosiphilum]